MDLHPIHVGVEYSYSLQTTETRDKRRPHAPLDSYADFTLISFAFIFMNKNVVIL